MSKKQSTKRGKWQVIVYADDKHTTEYLSEIFVTICGHGIMQAVQCAVLVDQVGMYAVYEDTFAECEEVYEELLQNDLIVQLRKKHVEKNKK
jgi:ATP-dependent Clp protease adapter protein ClpS